MKNTYLITEKGRTLVKADAKRVKDGKSPFIADGFECNAIAYKNMRDLIQLVTISYEAMIYADANIYRVRSNKDYNHWNNARNKAKVIWESSVRILEKIQKGSRFDYKW